MPHEGHLSEARLEGQGLEEVGAHNEVLGVHNLAMEIDELLCEVLRIVLHVLEVILREGQHRMLPYLGWSAPLGTTHDVPDREAARGDLEVPDCGHDAFEDLDFMSGLILVLILKTSLQHQCLN